METLETLLIQVQAIYNVGHGLAGEQRTCSTKRVADYVHMMHGQQTVDALNKMTHAELRKNITSFGIFERPKHLK